MKAESFIIRKYFNINPTWARNFSDVHKFLLMVITNMQNINYSLISKISILTKNVST